MQELPDMHNKYNNMRMLHRTCGSCTRTCYHITVLSSGVQAAAEDPRLQPALQEAGLTTQKLESAIQVQDTLKRCTGL